MNLFVHLLSALTFGVLLFLYLRELRKQRWTQRLIRFLTSCNEKEFIIATPVAFGERVSELLGVSWECSLSSTKNAVTPIYPTVFMRQLVAVKPRLVRCFEESRDGQRLTIFELLSGTTEDTKGLETTVGRQVITRIV